MSLHHTPLHASHVALGGRMVPFAGFEMPVMYRGVRKEHHAVREVGGLFDVSHMGEVFFRGPEATAAVSRLVSNDVSRLADGQAQYNAVCNERGGVVDDVVVYRFSEEEWMICVNAANRDKDYRWFVDRTEAVGVEIVDEGSAWAQIAVQGPRAEPLLNGLAEPELCDLPSFHHRRGRVAGASDCVIARTGYTGEDGFEVFCAADHAEAVWQALLATEELQPIGLGARDTLRLEARLCLYGHELTDETSPWQAGIGRFVALDKPGGFIGQQALRRRRGKEPERLVGLVLQGKRIAREQMDVCHEGAVVGRVTSGTRSPTLGSSIALAYVHRDLCRPGTELIVDVRGREAPARVVRGPFYTRDA